MARGPGLTEGVAGVPATFEINVEAEVGDKAIIPASSQPQFLVHLTGPVEVEGSVKEGPGGSLVGTYTAKVAGRYALSIIAHGKKVGSSPYWVNIAPGAKAKASECSAQGWGLSDGSVASVSSFTLMTRDEFGNRRTTGNDRIAATLHGPGPAQTHVADKHDGSYELQWVAARAGSYKLDLLINDEPSAQAQPINVRPSNLPANASTSAAAGEGLSSAVAGVRTSFVVSARDAYGNARQASGDRIVVHAVSGRMDGEVETTEEGSGQYKISYTPASAGKLVLAVQLQPSGPADERFKSRDFLPDFVDGSHGLRFEHRDEPLPIHRAPFDVSVGAGAVVPSQCVSERGPDLGLSAAGGSQTFDVSIHDS